MKEIEYQEETIVYKTKYEAIDGTIFFNKEECEKYEDTALAVLRSKFNKLIVDRHDAWDLMGGFDDHDAVAIRLNTKDDANVVMQLYYLYNPYYLKDENKTSAWINRYMKMVDDALNNKDLLIMGINCEDEPYFINTKSAIIENLKKFGKTTKTEPEYGGC